MWKCAMAKVRRGKRLEWSISLGRRRCLPAQLSLQLVGVFPAAAPAPVVPLGSDLPAVQVCRRRAQHPDWPEPFHLLHFVSVPPLRLLLSIMAIRHPMSLATAPHFPPPKIVTATNRREV